MVWPLILAGAAIAGGILQNSANKSIAEDNRNFQQYNSDTAHQREVRDLEAAGLNPILSATGGNGASTPQGAMIPMEDPLQKGINSGLAGMAMENQMDLNDSTIGLQSAQQGQALTQSDLNRANSELAHNSAQESMIRQEQLREAVNTQKATTDKIRKEIQEMDSNIKYGSPFKFMGYSAETVSNAIIQGGNYLRSLFDDVKGSNKKGNYSFFSSPRFNSYIGSDF